MLVFGIGLIATGRTGAGISVLGGGLLAMAIALSPSSAGRALLAAIGALVVSGVLAYHAITNEFTGEATYLHGFGRGSWSERVTKDSSPAKFREATNLLWTGSILVLATAIGLFTLRRKLDDYTDAG